MGEARRRPGPAAAAAGALACRRTDLPPFYKQTHTTKTRYLFLCYSTEGRDRIRSKKS